MIRGDLTSIVAAKMGLDASTAASVGPPANELFLLNKWAQEAVDRTLLKTHHFLQELSINLSLTSYMTSLADTVLAIDEVRLSGSQTRLLPVSESFIYELQRRGVTGIGVRYFAYSGNQLMVHEAPTVATAVLAMVVPRPGRMSADSNDIATVGFGPIPDQYMKAPEYYMLWQAAEYDDKRLPMTPKDYATLFSDECGEIRRWERRRMRSAHAPPIPGYPGQPKVVTRNDTYPRF